MTLDMVLLTVSIGLAGLLGFAAQRASICTVKAVLELMTSRRAFMLVSFAKTVVWVVLVTLLLGWWAPVRAGSAWNLSLIALAGGFLFGLGAAMNRGCAFSTLTGLAAGRLGMLLTLVGFGLGVAGYQALRAQHLIAPPDRGEALMGPSTDWRLILGAGLALWAAWELRRLWRSRPRPAGLRALVLAERYRLSTAALLIGVSNAVLFALWGVWPFTRVLGDEVRLVAGVPVTLEPVHWYLFAGVLAGMLLSAWQSGRFRLVWRPNRLWLAHLTGGTLMGLGAALVPGGNDVLILSAIPGLSPHALPAFLAMIAGIALAIAIMRLTGQAVEMVVCSGDLCRAE